MKFLCSFAKDQWNPDEWLKVRSPRWMESSSWIQREDHIANELPGDLRPEDMQMGRDRTGETYVSMLLKQPVHGSAFFRTRCCFDDRMAPLLVFSKELTPVHKEHLEVVLYDKGVNLWHHFWDGEKPSWKLIGFIDLDLKQGRAYDLSAQFIFCKKGIFLIMGCDGLTFGCRLDEWPHQYYAGFTACEGRNRFYDFELQEDPPLTGVMAERFSD